ncbi:MAG TPA: DegT/DnrJ/EryC1/StrS family aminotransferase [Myxococcaceae bacterium]|nr:DegT/DnrJ/EryC1/StrS family aminotransferase [Myxococcaceae bacterium]
MEAVTFIPALPTLWPRMLLAGRKPLPFPFSAPQVHYSYFCRNSVWLATRMLGLAGYEVLVPAYHHGVEIEALIEAGATLRFYRVGARWNVDLEDIDRKISSRTKALYVTHYAGFPGPVEPMRRIADRHGMVLIEDCALSLLSTAGGVPLGATGDVSVFCFYKTLPVPHGGALLINGRSPIRLPKLSRPPWTATGSHLASLLLQNLEMRGGAVGRWLRAALRRLGRTAADAAGVERIATGTQHLNRAHLSLGMSPLALRIARAQDCAAIVAARRRNYFYLLGQLRDLSAPLFTELAPGVCPLFYPLAVENKDEVMRRLRALGIETVDFWRHFHPACEPGQFPEAAHLRRTILELPCHQDLSPEQMRLIAAAVRKALAADVSPAFSRARL